MNMAKYKIPKKTLLLSFFVTLKILVSLIISQYVLLWHQIYLGYISIHNVLHNEIIEWLIQFTLNNIWLSQIFFLQYSKISVSYNRGPLYFLFYFGKKQ